MSSDESSLRCSKMVTGGYDWVDRIVLNAFFLIVDRHGLPGTFSLIAGRSVAPAVRRSGGQAVRRSGGQASFDIQPWVSAKVPR
jgi:hypothetical protein